MHFRVSHLFPPHSNTQDAARALQSALTATPPAPPAVLPGLRAAVLRARVALAERLGLRSQVEPRADAPTSAPAAAAGVVDDATVLLLLSLPKGKRLLARAVPMLLPVDRVAAVTAGMRHLPHFVASDDVGPVRGAEWASPASFHAPRPPPCISMSSQAADEANADLSASLTKWVGVTPPAPLSPGEVAADHAAVQGDFGGAVIASAAAASSSLGLCAAWLAELHSAIPGGVVRELLAVRRLAYL